MRAVLMITLVLLSITVAFAQNEQEFIPLGPDGQLPEGAIAEDSYFADGSRSLVMKANYYQLTDAQKRGHRYVIYRGGRWQPVWDGFTPTTPATAEDSRKQFMSSSAPPPVRGLMVGSSVLIPLRAAAEWVGAIVDFDRAARSITLSRGASTVSLTIGHKIAVVDYKEVALSTPAIERNGTTYVPLRFVGESLGVGVDWDSSTSRAFIANPDTGNTLQVNVR